MDRTEVVTDTLGINSNRDQISESTLVSPVISGRQPSPVKQRHPNLVLSPTVVNNVFVANNGASKDSSPFSCQYYLIIWLLNLSRLRAPLISNFVANRRLHSNKCPDSTFCTFNFLRQTFAISIRFLPTTLSTVVSAMTFRLIIEDGVFRDTLGRQIVLRGINVAGDAKLPSSPDMPSHVAKDFFEGDTVNFHQRPFPKEDAHLHFSRLRKMGYNTIRYIFTWEAIEAAGPGKYDEKFIQHTIDILRVAKEYGFYVFMDPHQDVVCLTTHCPLILFMQVGR